MWRATREPRAETPLGRRLARAAAWSALAQWLRLGASLLLFGVIASLLGPEALGLMALAGLVNALGYILVDEALLESLVQRERLEPGHADAMFWSVAGLGLAAMLACMAAAWPVAAVFERPEVASLVLASAPCLLLSALAAVPVALLQRGLRFDLLAGSALAGVIGGGTLGLTLALLGFGVWALVGQQLTTAAVELVAVYAFAGWRPGTAGRLRHVSELARFNLEVLAIRVLEYLNAQLPRSVIGYAFGAVAVGEFTFARRFVELLSSVLIHPVARVAFPAFSRTRQDGSQTRRYLMLGLWMSSLATYPAFLGLALVAPAMVTLVFGEKWSAAGLLLQILAISGVRKGPAAINYALVRAKGVPRLQALSLLLALVVSAAAMLALLPYGLMGIGIAILLRDLSIWPLSLVFVARLSQVGVGEQLGTSMRPAVAAGLMALAILLFQWVLGDADWPSLVSEVALGAVVYCAALLALDRRRLREAGEILRGVALPALPVQRSLESSS